MEAKIIFAMILLWGFCVCLVANANTNVVSNHNAALASNLFGGVVPGMACLNHTYSCAGKGDSCVQGMSVCTNMTNSSCCAAGLYCINSTCQTDNIGSPCKNITQCFGKITSGPYNCINGTCQYVYGPGDGCSMNSDCLYGLKCNNSMCQGMELGQTCSPGQCGFGLYCGYNGTLGTCMNAPKAGQPCAGGVICYPGTSCLSGKCVSDFSVPSGQSCTSDSCNTGLICAANATCVTADTSLTSCTNDTQCPSGQSCDCSPFTGDSFCSSPYVDPCTDQASELSQCIVSKNCTSINDSPDSCCYSNCYSEYKKALSCGCSNSKSVTGNCSYNPYCSGFPVWAIIVIIVVAIVLVLAIVLLVFFMMRRRRQYDSI